MTGTCTPKRDWVLCFEQYGEGTRYHIRAVDVAILGDDSLCGLELSGLATRTIKFEDELEESQMCQTCKRHALAAAAKEMEDK